MDSAPSPSEPNPFSTGGGGVVFEQFVGTFYLASLLAQEMPRGLEKGIAVSVAFQQRWAGAMLDDIVVTSDDGAQTYKLAIQVKHDLPFSEKDQDFLRVIADCWDVYRGRRGWPFDPARDRLGIAIGNWTKDFSQHLQRIFELSRACTSAAEFSGKLESSAVFSKPKRNYVEAIRRGLRLAANEEVSDETLWNVLRCMVVMHFDCEAAGGLESWLVRNRCLELVADRTEQQARLLFGALSTIVREKAPLAASVDLPQLLTFIGHGILLSDRPNFRSDLRKLKNHTDLVLSDIKATIGNELRLDRSEYVDRILEAFDQAHVVILVGEPGAGKSAVLRQFCEYLKGDGTALAFSTLRLKFPTVESFLSDLGLEFDFLSILGAVSSGRRRCLSIDGLERAFDEDIRTTASDLIRLVFRHNSEWAARGASHANSWKILLTCRKEELSRILVQLPFREAATSPQVTEISGLSDRELVAVGTQFPSLAYLISQPHVQELLRRPLIIDLLASKSGGMPAATSYLSEAWLMEWFWNEIVRAGERTGTSLPEPDERQRVMLSCAKQLLERGGSWVTDEALDSKALTTLVSDRLLIREDGRVRFAHDVFQDWATAMLLVRLDTSSVIDQLVKSQDHPALHRPFSLWAHRLLDLKKDFATWCAAVAMVNLPHISPRWLRILLVSPLTASQASEILPQIKDVYFENKGVRLQTALLALRSSATYPEIRTLIAWAAVGGGTDKVDIEFVASNFGIPIIDIWLPVLRFVLQDAMKEEGVFHGEVIRCFRAFLQRTPPGTPLRTEVADAVFQKLSSIPRGRHILDPEGYLKDLTIAALHSADCDAERVARFIDERTVSRDHDFFELLLSPDGYQPLCRHLSDKLVDVMLGSFCQDEDEEDEGHRFPLGRGLGIAEHLHELFPPTPYKGPFLALLRENRDAGLRLVHGLVNHATRWWVRREQLRGLRSVPQRIRVDSKEIELWGDHFIYKWCCALNAAPNPVSCALISLEAWMVERIEHGDDPAALFNSVLEDSQSVAVVGTCVLVALALPDKCRHAILPIAENPAFWELDLHRYLEDQHSPARIRNLSGMGLHKQFDFDIELKWAEKPHRQSYLELLVTRIMLAYPDARERLLPIIRRFPESPPAYYTEQLDSSAFLDRQKEMCSFMAARTDVEKFEAIESDEPGKVLLRPTLPPELEAKREAAELKTAALNRAIRLLNWGLRYLDDGQAGPSMSAEQALASAEELSGVSVQHSEDEGEQFFFERQIEYAVAAAAAALVRYQPDVLLRLGKFDWCRDQLIKAAFVGTKTDYDSEMSVFSMGADRSAARALPFALLGKTDDKRVRDAIMKLTLDPHYEVRAYLYGALGRVRANFPEVVKLAVTLGLQHAVETVARSDWRGNSELEKWRAETYQRIAAGETGVEAPRLHSVSHHHVDHRALQCVLNALYPSNELSAEANRWGLEIVGDLFRHTLNAYLQVASSKEDHHHSELQLFEWVDSIGRIFAEYLLHETTSHSDCTYLDKLLKDWEKAMLLLAEILRFLILGGSDATDRQPRMLKLHRRIFEVVLSSSRYDSMRGWVDREEGEILGFLIFVDTSGSTKWKVKEWKPLQDHLGLIDRWCARVGHIPDAFRALLNLCKTIAMPFFVPNGLSWISSILRQTKDTKELFKYQAAEALSELLLEGWREKATEIRANDSALKNFTYLLDRLAENGDTFSIRLLQELHSPIRWTPRS